LEQRLSETKEENGVLLDNAATSERDAQAWQEKASELTRKLSDSENRTTVLRERVKEMERELAETKKLATYRQSLQLWDKCKDLESQLAEHNQALVAEHDRVVELERQLDAKDAEAAKAANDLIEGYESQLSARRGTVEEITHYRMVEPDKAKGAR
jgi:chromosome segregation ATPase